MKKSEELVEVDASGSYSTYFEYNKVLRTWFVTFGAGGPALLLLNANLAKQLADAGRLRLVVGLFLVGVGAQVLGAFVNKVSNWYVHDGYSGSAVLTSRKHKLAELLAGQFWIDILMDIVTIAVFAYAAWVLQTVFVI